MSSFGRSILLRCCLPFAVMVAATVGIAIKAYAGDVTGQFQFEGQERTYTVHRPEGPPPPGGFAVILAFHGGGMQGRQMQKLTHLDSVADSRHFIAVYPDGVDKHWNDGRASIKNPQNDVGFVATLIGRLEADYAIDRGRIYATGISNGALFTERLGCDLSQRITGIAPVAGTLPVDMLSRCRPSRAVAVMQIDGTADPIMPFRGGSVADFGGRGEGGEVLSVAATTAFWERHDGCVTVTSPELMPRTALFDRTRVMRVTYGGCVATTAVQLLTVVGGGHTWPGGPQYARPMIVGLRSRQFDASSTIADFFLSLPPAG